MEYGWELIHCDNLSFHLDEGVRDNFFDEKVFICYLRPNMTNFLQHIDSGLWRSLCIAICDFLYEWPMNA